MLQHIHALLPGTARSPLPIAFDGRFLARRRVVDAGRVKATHDFE